MCERFLLCLCVLFSPSVLLAQSYRTVIADEDRYFLDSDSLNIGIRVVETDTLSNGVIHTFYPDVRPAVYGDGSACVPDPDCSLWEAEVYYNLNGPGWMGKEVFVRNDGMNVYFNLNSDSIFVNTGAALNESWTVYRNSGDTLITGEITEINQGSSLDPNENVKTIELQASYLGVPISHPLNGLEWRLSENNGWQAVHSLYWFPDFPLPETQTSYECALGGIYPGHEQYDTTVHVLTSFQPSTVSEMLQLEIGDVFQIREQEPDISNPPDFPWIYSYATYTVIGVAALNGNLVVDFEVAGFNSHTGSIWTDTIQEDFGRLDDPFPTGVLSGHQLDGARYWHFSDSMNYSGNLFGIEQVRQNCNGTYVLKEELWNVGDSGGCAEFWSQADGCYGPYVYWQSIPFPIVYQNCAFGAWGDLPVYVNTSFCQFGSLQVLGVDEITSNQLQVFPNPTQDQLNFQSPEQGTLSVLDLSGRTVLTSAASKGQNTIDVSSLPDGIYLLQLQTENSISSARFVKN